MPHHYSFWNPTTTTESTMASPLLPTTVVTQTPASPQTNGDPATRSPTIVTAPQTPKRAAADDEPAAAMQPTTTTTATRSAAAGAGSVMSSAANLAQLLPTGTVLAYQALSPSFTNHGTCHPANKWLTATLVLILSALCVFFSFTDSVLGRDGKLYYGVATPRGFNVFNFSGDEEDRLWALGVLRKLRVRPVDYIHAVFSAMVFLAVVFGDAGLQRCFFPDASDNTNELLKNLPLGMAFLSSFVFMIFPTKRKGIGYADTAPQKKASS